MPIPPHVAYLRERVGHITLLLPAAAAVVRDERDRVLLIRRGDGRGWSLPGGVMEPGECIADCAVRETQEETGLEVEPIRLVGIYSDPDVLQITFYPQAPVSSEKIVSALAGASRGSRMTGEDRIDLVWSAEETGERFGEALALLRSLR